MFYTPGKCWQFRVISPDGSVFGSQQIFYTPQAALLGWYQLGCWWRCLSGIDGVRSLLKPSIGDRVLRGNVVDRRSLPP
ncbi:MAG: hypothetical protein V7K72_09840 [Nostoc sp.]